MRTDGFLPELARAALGAMLLAIALSLTSSPAQAQAQWSTNGVPVCVIPGCSGFDPLICGDGAGGALVAWNRDPTFSDRNIYVHRVLHSGELSPVWPPKGTPVTRAPGDQNLRNLVADGSGGAFIAWYEWPTHDVYAQHVLGDGTIAPGWPVDGLPVSARPGYQIDPQLLADGAGGVFVVWTDGQPNVAGDIFAQHLNGDGTRVAGWPDSGLALCTNSGLQGGPYLARDGQGGFIAAWSDLRTAEPYAPKLYGTRVSWSGEFAPGWPANGREIIGREGGHGIKGMVPDGTSGAYIGWQHNFGPDTDENVYTVRILGDGSIAPGWPAGGYPVSARPGAQYVTSVVADGVGGVLLGWYDSLEQPAVAFVQRLGPDGTPALGWPASGLRASDVDGWHFRPKLAPDGMGGVFAVTEIQTDGNHGWVQHLTAGGSRAPGWPAAGVPVVNLDGVQTELEITTDGAGGAIVAWNDWRDGRQDQIYAQRFFGDGPTPVLVSLVSAEALPDRVSLIWHRAGDALSAAEVQRRREGDSWAGIGKVLFDGTGKARFDDRDVIPGARYAYRLGWAESGHEQFSAETWVDVPRSLTLALEGARPNPVSGPLTVAFSLPHERPATLEVLDVAGRRVLARDVGGLGAGRHLVRLGECGCTPPGMYLLRLTQAGQSLLKRAVIVN